MEIEVIVGQLRYQIKDRLQVVWEQFLPLSAEAQWRLKRKGRMILRGRMARLKAEFFKVDQEIIDLIGDE